MTEKQLIAHKKEVVDICKRLYEKGFAEGTSGNVSIKLEDGYIVTCSGCCLGTLSLKDIVYVPFDKSHKDQYSGKPTSELNMHISIYNRRPDIKSIVHAHPHYCTAFAVSGISLNPPCLPEALVNLGEIPTVPYQLPSSEALGESVAEYALSTNALLMANHGAVTLGTTVLEAYHRMETLESYAKIVFLAKQLGNINYLSAEDLESVKGLINTVYAK